MTKVVGLRHIKLPQNPFYQWIKGRIKANKNVIIVINGGTGSGKTYSAISIAKTCADMLGSNFTVNDNIEFNFPELLKLMQLPQNQKSGTPFIFEEVGAFGGGASAREWQSQANKFFFSFMQTSRHRNQIFIMTCPNFSFLERGARSLVHMQINTNGIDFRRKVAYLKPYCVQINVRTGKFYFKYLRAKYKGKRIKVSRLEVPCPSDELLIPYEELKSKYTAALNQEMIDQAKKEEEKKEKSSWSCRVCEHSWFPRSKVPSYCPRCQKRDIYSDKPEIST